MLTALTLMLAQASAAAAPAPIRSIDEATKKIERRNSELFWYACKGCDTD